MSAAVADRTVRSWGDGGGDKRPHVIEDISYNDTPNWLVCRDGTRLEADTASALERAWQDHGGKVMTFIDVVDRKTAIGHVLPPEDRWEQWVLVAQQAVACTCATTSVEDCPNYLPGDER